MWFWKKSVPNEAQVDGRRARELVAAGATLVDVRTVAEFRTGSLPGAINLPLNRLPRHTEGITPGRPVVVFCRSGARSARAASDLIKAGFKVYDLGAIGAWGRDVSDPVVASHNAATA